MSTKVSKDTVNFIATDFTSPDDNTVPTTLAVQTLIDSGSSTKDYVTFMYNNQSTGITDNNWLYLWNSGGNPSGVNGGLINGTFDPYNVPCGKKLTEVCIRIGKALSQNTVSTNDDVGVGIEITSHAYDSFSSFATLDVVFQAGENINAGQYG